MELFHAHRQWASRPEDERFTDLRTMFDATVTYAKVAVELERVNVKDLRVEVADGDIRLVGKKDRPARLTNWSAKQLSERVGAPHGYISTLPATLAAQNLNHGLAHRVKEDEDAMVNLMLHENGDLVLRCLTGTAYSRVWNFEVLAELLEMESQGWSPAKPDAGWSQDDGRRPLYASDRDMFAFIVHPDRVIKEEGNPSGLLRGMIVMNSEVGGGKLRILKFLYRMMCGNHIIWGAEDVSELSAIHVGQKIHQKFDEWKVEITRYFDGSTSDEEARVMEAQRTVIAPDKDALMAALFGTLGLSRKVIAAGFEAVAEGDGNPLSAWGMAQGLTRYSQTLPHADARTAVDRAAGKLLSMRF